MHPRGCGARLSRWKSGHVAQSWDVTGMRALAGVLSHAPRRKSVDTKIRAILPIIVSLFVCVCVCVCVCVFLSVYSFFRKAPSLRAIFSLHTAAAVVRIMRHQHAPAWREAKGCGVFESRTPPPSRPPKVFEAVFLQFEILGKSAGWGKKIFSEKNCPSAQTPISQGPTRR